MQSLANRNSGIRDFDESMRSKPRPQIETMESKVARLEAEIVKLKEQVGLARDHAWRASRGRGTPTLWNPLRSNGSLLG